MTFKEPVHKILDQINNEPYFQWPSKIEGDPSRRNQNLCCTYHRDKGQLVRSRHLKEFVLEPRGLKTEQTTRPRGNPLPPPLGVIHTALRGTLVTQRKGVLIVVPAESCQEQPLGKRMKYARESIAFNDEDLEGKTQPHNDALVVTARINGFIVKRVLMDQGSGFEVMYPNLIKGLDLKNEDLSKYDTPLVGFDGRMVVFERQISFPINMERKEVIMTFMVVSSFSLYTAILGWLWIHAMGAVLSTLHVKSSFTPSMILQQ